MASLKKKLKPKFNVMNLGFIKRVKERWRKPRGIDNKKRIRCKFAGASPRIGYRNPRELRGLHPSGKKEILVYNIQQLECLEKEKESVVLRIASCVGKKKRELMIAKAQQLGIKILNA
jgi:large subunit ribosomal protein L32e